MFKILKELLKKHLPVTVSKINTTSALEKAGRLLDLSSLDIDDKPVSPYGKYLGTLKVEYQKFENGMLVVVYDVGLTSEKVLSSNFIKSK